VALRAEAAWIEHGAFAFRTWVDPCSDAQRRSALDHALDALRVRGLG
jgi:hypothetical protein